MWGQETKGLEDVTAGCGKKGSGELAVALGFHEFFEGVANSELKETRSRGFNGQAKCYFVSFYDKCVEFLSFFRFQGWGGVCDVTN